MKFDWEKWLIRGFIALFWIMTIMLLLKLTQEAAR